MLLWKPFTDDAVPPKWIRPKEKPVIESDKVTVSAFRNGWCPAMSMAFERTKRAVAEPEFAGKVIFKEVDTSDREEFDRWGIADAVFINNKEVRLGPPPSYEKIKKAIAKQVKKTL